MIDRNDDYGRVGETASDAPEGYEEFASHLEADLEVEAAYLRDHPRCAACGARAVTAVEKRHLGRDGVPLFVAGS